MEGVVDHFSCYTMMESSDTITSLRHISDIYPIIGDGRYQLLIIMAGCISTIPIGMQEFMLVFLAFNPGWQCEGSSNVCLYNGTVLSSDPHFNARCTMNRTDWKLVDTKGFSIVNEVRSICCIFLMKVKNVVHVKQTGERKNQENLESLMLMKITVKIFNFFQIDLFSKFS